MCCKKEKANGLGNQPGRFNRYGKNTSKKVQRYASRLKEHRENSSMPDQSEGEARVHREPAMHDKP